MISELITLLKTDANAANAFAAMASAFVALLALLVSTLSVWLSIRAMSAQQKHNELAVRPLAEITVGDYEDSLRVKLINNGTGPMIIGILEVDNGTHTKSSIIDWMPLLPAGRYWTNFTQSLEDRTLQPGSEIVLLELTEHESETDFASCRDITRNALAPLTVRVNYKDIYNKSMPPRSKSLSWFGRHR